MRVLVLVATMLVLISSRPTFAETAAIPACTFELGFKTIHDLIPDVVGACQMNAQAQPNGDVQQPTSNGLLAWRNLDNWTAFTNGDRTWVNGPCGLQDRANNEIFLWEGIPDAPCYEGVIRPAAVGGDWLDAPLAPWNRAGAPIPIPARRAGDDVCPSFEPRAAETASEAAVTAAGWFLGGSSESGWGVVLVPGFAGFDGMCRFTDTQVFAFVDSTFAGTISPVVMEARSDGIASDWGIDGPDGVWARFTRYGESDPRCCPSGPDTYVDFLISRTASGPILIPIAKRAAT